MRRWVSSPDYDVVVGTLVEARKSAGVSQAELAKRLAKPPSYVAKIELKERRVDIVELIAILRALGASEGAAFKAISSQVALRPDV